MYITGLSIIILDFSKLNKITISTPHTKNRTTHVKIPKYPQQPISHPTHLLKIGTPTKNFTHKKTTDHIDKIKVIPI